MGEAILRRRAAEASLPLEVSSAGFLFDGEPAADDAIAVMAELGYDLSAHRSRMVDAGMVASADLVVTMERTHARSLVLEVPEAADRVHTLGAAVVGLSRPGGGGARERIVGLGRQRSASDLLGRGDDEIADPHGRPRRHHRRTAERLDRLMTELVAALAR